MNTATARRIRQGLKAFEYAETFRSYFTFQTAVDHHRRKLTSVAALMAFDRAKARADVRAMIAAAEELRISVEFARIINHNFQETS